MFGLNIGIGDIATWLGAAVTVGGLVIAWVRFQLSDVFAARGDITALVSRVEKIETKIGNVPTHDDLRRIADRLGVIENGFSELGAELRGMRDGVRRVENDLRLLLQHELSKGKPPS